MLVFKACGECDNVVECPHTPKYNEEDRGKKGLED